jgi:pimeloyl-ACP methyl ester carboxylesterase
MIKYLTAGNQNNKNLLVCIPGLGTNSSIFIDLVNELNRLNLFIISPDLRGCGQSADIKGEYSINEATDDIKEILDGYKDYNTVVLGYSQGGTIAQLLAKKYPDNIHGLILCNTFAYNTGTFKEKFETYFSILILKIFGIKGFGRLVVNEFKKDKQIPVFQFGNLTQMFAKNNKQAIISYLKHLLKFDSRTWLNQIKQPCLIIRGQNDNAVPQYHTNILSNLIPNSKTFEIGKGGHLMIWTHIKQLAQIITDNYPTIKPTKNCN